MVGEGEDMTVAQLIVELQKLPQGAPVQAVNYDGCCECNSEGFAQYHDVTRASFQGELNYPCHDEHNIVVLE
jgi:hypothetical protein